MHPPIAGYKPATKGSGGEMRGDYGVGIVGVGHSLPAHAAPGVDGAPPTYRVGPDESAATLALAAARAALADAGVAPDQVGLIVVCTFSGDYVFPPLSAKLQGALGATGAQVFDLQANCAGFVTGLTTASDRLRVDPSVGHALVIGVETHARFVDPAAPGAAAGFSDGAGAAVLGRVEAGAGILDSHFHTDGALYEAMRLRDGGARIEIDGAATWQPVVGQLPATVRRACEKAGTAPADVDLCVFHQANLPLIYYVMKKLGLPTDRTHTNLEAIGNTGAASVAIALSEAVAQGKLRAGQTLVLAAAGAGLTFSASVWKWAGR